jgi:hypothetical protein
VVTAGLATAAVWFAIMVLRGSYELTNMLVSPDAVVDAFDAFPGRGLFEGLLSTTGLTYLVLAVAEQPRRLRRRRSRSGQHRELATAASQTPDDL